MVSSIISNCTLFESIETTVRQTPLIDTLAPMAKFSTLGKLIVIEVTVLTVVLATISPTPCTIPVNIAITSIVVACKLKYPSNYLSCSVQIIC